MALGVYWATICLCLLLAVLSLDRMGYFSKNHFHVDGRVGGEYARSENAETDGIDRLSSLQEAHKEWAAVSENCWHRKEQMLLS